MSRRANGEGTLYHRADGRWEGAVIVPTSSGQRRRIRVYGSTRVEAHTKLVAALKRASDGVPAPDKPWKVGAYLEYWLDTCRLLIAPTTHALYGGLVRNYLVPGLGSKSLGTLNVITVQRYFNELLAAGASVRAVQKARVALSAALTQAMREELVVRNVARSVRLPTSKRQPITPWTVDQLQTFLSAAKGDPLYAALLMVGVYGLRTGEVRGLRWSDIDWDNNRVLIRQQVQRYDGAMHVRELKTRASRRDLPLLQSVREALSAKRTSLSGPVSANQLIFLTRTDNPIESGNILRSFQRISEGAGLPKIRLHHLRHTAATLLKNDGVPDRDIQLILGHESILTTQMLYQHADLEGQQRALRKIEQRTLTAGTVRGDCRQDRNNQPLTKGSQAVDNFGHLAAITGNEGNVFRTSGDPVPTGLTEVVKIARARYRTALLGGAAVNFAVRPHHDFL